MVIKLTQVDGTAIEFDTVEELREFEATQGGLETNCDSDETATSTESTEVEGTMIFSADDLSLGDKVVFAEDYTDDLGYSAVKGDVGEYLGKSGGSSSAMIMMDPPTSVFVKPNDVSTVLRRVPTTPEPSPSFEVGDFVEISLLIDMTGLTKGRFYKVTEVETWGGVKFFDDDGNHRNRHLTEVTEVIKASELSDKITEGAHIATKGITGMRAFDDYKLYEVTSIDCDGDFKATDEDDCSMRIYESEVVSFVPASESDSEETPAKRRESITRDKHEDEFSVGDKIRVLSNCHHGEFAIGTIGTITSTGHNPNYEVTANDGKWYYEGDGDIELVEPLGKDANGEDLYEGDLVTGIPNNDYSLSTDEVLMKVYEDNDTDVFGRIAVKKADGTLFVGDLGSQENCWVRTNQFVKTTEEEFNAPKFRVGDAVFFTEDYVDKYSDEAKEGTNGIIVRELDHTLAVRVHDKSIVVEHGDAPNVLEIIRKAND